jgi:hypothetical protein
MASSPQPSPALTDFIRACTGAIASVVSTAVLLPLDVCKAKLYANNKKKSDASTNLPKNIWALAASVYQKEGFRGLYNGGHVRLLEQLSTKFTFYYLYSYFTQIFTLKDNFKMGAFLSLFVGYVAAVTNTLLTFPIQLVSAVMMVESSESNSNRTLLQVTKSIVKKTGSYTGLYRGIFPSIVLSINPAIEFMVFEQLKQQFLKANKLGAATNLSIGAAFWLGVIAKAFATFITFPYIRVKVLMQVGKNRVKDKDGKVTKKMMTSSEVFMYILQDEGFFGLWGGVEAQLSKALLSSGLKFAIDESVKDIVKQFLLSILVS